LQIKTIDLKSDRPTVREALVRLDRELAIARREKVGLLKIIHGYGSTGVGGDIRLSLQKRLLEMAESNSVKAVIFGENWSKSDEVTWRLIQEHPELKNDTHLGRGNLGVSIVLID
jgi:hypothetical protein